MKLVWSLLPSAVKGVIAVIAFLLSMGWASYGAVLLIVNAEGNEIRRELKNVRDNDMEHLNKRFDRIETLIIKRK